MRRERKRRLLACLLVTLFIMIQTIRHMFEGVRPFDWLMLFIEIAVVGLILYEIIADALRRRAEARRERFIHEQIIALTQRLTKGKRLHGGVPNTTTCNPQTAERMDNVWIEQVGMWITDTEKFLSSRSPRASAEFMALIDSGPVNLYVGNTPHGYFLRKESAEWYGNLTIHLENLQRIMSTPEAYF
jgi:hypothetical protein